MQAGPERTIGGELQLGHFAQILGQHIDRKSGGHRQRGSERIGVSRWGHRRGPDGRKLEAEQIKRPTHRRPLKDDLHLIDVGKVGPGFLIIADLAQGDGQLRFAGTQAIARQGNPNTSPIPLNQIEIGGQFACSARLQEQGLIAGQRRGDLVNPQRPACKEAAIQGKGQLRLAGNLVTAIVSIGAAVTGRCDTRRAQQFLVDQGEGLTSRGGGWRGWSGRCSGGGGGCTTTGCTNEQQKNT